MDLTLIIIAVIVVLILFYVYVTYNSLIRLKNNVEEGFSTMDVYLKKRWDLIPNLVNTVKGYAKHEAETLASVIGLRGSSYDSMNVDDKVAVNNELTATLSKLMMVAENYPDLKANQNFMDLSNNLSQIEDEIANARKYYNAVVLNYNNKVEMVPSNIIAGIFKFAKKAMFEAPTESRENVKVEF